MSVLIVDDDADIRDTLKELCEDEGYDVATAANGADAMRILTGAILPCVVILDLIMPIMTGNEVFAAMQQEPRLARVPVIVSTSDPSRAPSGVLIMKKPIDIDRLLGAIRRYCGPS
ncbi:MAG TPA: response regulator [Polyangiaceae bacterium]|jgi:CheY-like chemotaxis protein|nr:response regulator [Polyangiaceae bacterium]